MKKKIIILVAILIVVLIATIIGIKHYHDNNPQECLVYRWNLFDHIQYNGKDYYLVDSKYQLSVNGGNLTGTYNISIVNSNGSVHGNPDSYIAKGPSNVAEDEIKYLYFNSALYTCDKDLISSHYKLD